MKYGFHLLALHPCQSVGIHVISIAFRNGNGGAEEIMRGMSQYHQWMI